MATFDDHDVIVVIQNVPAHVCAQCGEPDFDGPTTDRLLPLVHQTGARTGARSKARH
jgi:hypothetical protein